MRLMRLLMVKGGGVWQADDGVDASSSPSSVPSGQALVFQEALSVERRHAAGTGAGDSLAVDMVLHVAGGEDARDAGGGGHAFQAGLGLDVAVMHLQLA